MTDGPYPYAYRTKVPVSKTRIQIDVLLSKHGATQRAVATDEDRGFNMVMFSIAAGDSRRQIKLELPCVVDDPAEDRRVWRVLYMSLKMKLELIAHGDSDVDREFLPNVVLPNGRTVLESIAPDIDAAYLDGKMPPLLGAAKPMRRRKKKP